jgi:hypothetical protein
MTITMKNWLVTARDLGEENPYLAPECRKSAACLSGQITHHPELVITKDENRVTTSSIVNVDGRIVTTFSGRKYKLYGRPDPRFMEFLGSKELPYNPRNPLAPLVGAGFIAIGG